MPGRRRPRRAPLLPPPAGTPPASPAAPPLTHQICNPAPSRTQILCAPLSHTQDAPLCVLAAAAGLLQPQNNLVLSAIMSTSTHHAGSNLIRSAIIVRFEISVWSNCRGSSSSPEHIPQVCTGRRWTATLFLHVAAHCHLHQQSSRLSVAKIYCPWIAESMQAAV